MRANCCLSRRTVPLPRLRPLDSNSRTAAFAPRGRGGRSPPGDIPLLPSSVRTTNAVQPTASPRELMKIRQILDPSEVIADLAGPAKLDVLRALCVPVA